MDEYIVRVITLPPSVRALVTLGDDGFYSVYVNSRLSQEEQEEAVAHEMRHISCGHFYKKEKPTQKCEREAAV